MIDNEQLVNVDGLEFKPYQMECISKLAELDGRANIKKYPDLEQYYREAGVPMQ